jgi:hypothetical protein
MATAAKKTADKASTKAAASKAHPKSKHPVAAHPTAKKAHPVAKSAASERKEKKMTQAMEIYQANIAKKDTMTKREFRALIVEQFKQKLGLENAGTIGMYYSIVDARITGRKFKSYNRVAERKPNRTPEQREIDRNDRLTSREKRLAERAAMKAAKQAAKTPQVAGTTIADAALSALANDALAQINHITDVIRHQAEVLHANQPPATKKAAKKAPAKKTAAKKTAKAV